jgi:hypothetical protein
MGFRLFEYLKSKAMLLPLLHFFLRAVICGMTWSSDKIGCGDSVMGILEGRPNLCAGEALDFNSTFDLFEHFNQKRGKKIWGLFC